MTPNNGFTHAGLFHADEVFATALLEILNPDFVWTRGFKVPQDFEGIVYDIGLGAFDHHQEDHEYRVNDDGNQGVPYAAFGLVWREYGRMLLSEHFYQKFDEECVIPIDYSDNNPETNPLSLAIKMMNPTWDSSESADEAFKKAVSFAKTVINGYLDTYHAEERAAEGMAEAAKGITEDGIIVMDRYLPWRNYVPENCRYVVYPGQRGGFCAMPVNAEDNFPQEWRGKSPDMIAEVSGIPTMTFCHPGGFILSCNTVDDCIAACRKH